MISDRGPDSQAPRRWDPDTVIAAGILPGSPATEPYRREGGGGRGGATLALAVDPDRGRQEASPFRNRYP
jgi:hypothetical protein